MGIVCKGSAVLAGWLAATHYKIIQSPLQKRSTRLHYPDVLTAMSHSKVKVQQEALCSTYHMQRVGQSP